MWKRISPDTLHTLDARSICIIKPSALGDVIQSLPLLRALRDRFPKARISWVINRELAPLLEGHRGIDKLIPFDRHGSIRDWNRLLSGLNEAEFDLAFDLQGLARTGLMLLATRAAVRVGLETAREGAHLACNCVLPNTSRQLPAHRLYWRVAEILGLGDLPQDADVPLQPAAAQWAAAQLAPLARPLLAVNPGAKWKTKRWPVERFAVVAGKAARHHRCGLVLLAGPGETALSAMLEKLLQDFVPRQSVVNLGGQTSLPQLAAVLQQVDAVVTNDSGPMHLAAALGTPVVGVFTCTSPLRSGPAGSRHELVATEVSCAASYRKQCPHHGPGHMACMDELQTGRVVAALAHLLEKNHIGRRAA